MGALRLGSYQKADNNEVESLLLNMLSEECKKERKKYFLRPEKKVAFLFLTVLRVSNLGNGMFFPLF